MCFKVIQTKRILRDRLTHTLKLGLWNELYKRDYMSQCSDNSLMYTRPAAGSNTMTGETEIGEAGAPAHVTKKNKIAPWLDEHTLEGASKVVKS